jgi:hypothetical protein
MNAKQKNVSRFGDSQSKMMMLGQFETIWQNPIKRLYRDEMQKPDPRSEATFQLEFTN